MVNWQAELIRLRGALPMSRSHSAASADITTTAAPSEIERHKPCEGKTVGTLPKGVPVPALPWTKWSDVGRLLVGAVGIILVSLTDTIATATNVASRRGDEVDPDQEMVGIGTLKYRCWILPGVRRLRQRLRVALADQSGARIQLSGLVAVRLLFLSGLLADLPQTALSSGIRSGGWHAIASRTWCTAMASVPRWTESTSIPASPRPSMRSTMRPWTALCRPMKGCRLHEHRP